MTTTCSQKLAFGFTLLSMALAIVTFTSPGIYVLRIPKNKKIEIDPALLPEQSKPSKLTPAHDPIVVKIPKTVILGCGLFYFQTCVKSDHDYDALIPNYASWGDDEYCELNTYHHAKHAARHLAEPLQGMDMEEIYKNIAGTYYIQEQGCFMCALRPRVIDSQGHLEYSVSAEKNESWYECIVSLA